VSFVIKLVQRWRQQGTLSPGQMGGWKDYALAEHEELVRGLVTARPDLTLDELRDALGQAGIRIGRSSVRRFLLARGLTLKKRRSMRANNTGLMLPKRARPGASASRA
jgi:transposase